MKCLRFLGPWNLEFADFEPPPTPVGDQVLVSIRRSTICGTDLGIVAGLYDATAPLILGHEAAGVVAAVGDTVSSLQVGNRVVIDPTYFCLQCRNCRNGLGNHCERKVGTETGVSRDGTFAPCYLTQERFLYPVRENICFEEACFTEPLSCVLTGLKQLRLRSNLATVVVGGGPMGMLYAHALRLQGVSGVLIEVSKSRRERCEKLAPVGWKIATSMNSAAKALPQGRFDLAVDTSGVMLGPLLSRAHRGAQILLVGLRPGNVSISPHELTDRSISLVGSIDSQGTFAEALDLITRRVIPVGALVTKICPLADYCSAFGFLGCNLRSRTLKPKSQHMKIAFTME